MNLVIHAMTMLHGERNSPELPIPDSAVREYRRRYGLSEMFGSMVHVYDRTIIAGSLKTISGGSSNGSIESKTS